MRATPRRDGSARRRRRARGLSALLPLSLALAALGCDDPLSYPQDITELRVIGVRAEVTSRPGYAWPEPGESVDVSVLVAAPGALPPIAWRFEACLMDSSPDGNVACHEAPIVSAEGDGVPGFTVAVPGHAAARLQLGVRGVLCEAGELLPVGLECASGRRLDVSTRLGIAGEVQNQLPELAAAELTLNGVGFEPQPEGASCETAAEPARAAAGSDLALRLKLPAALREALPADRRGFDALGVNETLRIDWYATHGRLRPAASFIEADEPLAEAELAAALHAPEVSAPTWVRFWVVARDQRGGSSHLERGVCVSP